jgi:predicted nucleotidyltransferase
MLDYQKQILEELKKIENEEQVRILYACESGSRAWGFPSKDSDYDVRFLYVRPIEWYLSIFDKRDVIERPIHDMLDINGWDLRKALNLFRKSNPPLLEWLQSPIQYYENYSVAEQLRKLLSSAFSPKSCMYHYLNMAKGNFREYLQGDQVKIKKYFYVLRPILGCMWIEERNNMPPMEFERLVDELLPADSKLRSEIARLLKRKKSGEELDLEPKITVINDFIHEKIEHFERTAKVLPSTERNLDRQLDELFREALKEVWRR